jgi:hypothetical protein
MGMGMWFGERTTTAATAAAATDHDHDGEQQQQTAVMLEASRAGRNTVLLFPITVR